MMKMPMYMLRVESQFSSSHQLRNYQGKCENLHGHNFDVQLEVCGCQLDPKVGILIDFKVLKALLKNVLEELDHQHLNDLPAFSENNPSSEYLAQYIYKQVQIGLNKRPEPVQVRRVMVSEKQSSQAWYWEE